MLLKLCPLAFRRAVTPAYLYRPSIRFASTKRYTEAHEWISLDESSSIGTMGITNFAQNSLGDVVFVELPAKGSNISKGDQIGAVESVKAASDIYAPVSGAVEEINVALNDKPGLLNKSAESDGWLCKIKLSDKAELDDLLDEKKYNDFCQGEGGH